MNKDSKIETICALAELMDDDFRADVIKAATKEEVLGLLNGIL